jgi:hypothetical protein
MTQDHWSAKRGSLGHVERGRSRDPLPVILLELVVFFGLVVLFGLLLFGLVFFGLVLFGLVLFFRLVLFLRLLRRPDVPAGVRLLLVGGASWVDRLRTTARIGRRSGLSPAVRDGNVGVVRYVGTGGTARVRVSARLRDLLVGFCRVADLLNGAL